MFGVENTHIVSHFQSLCYCLFVPVALKSSSGNIPFHIQGFTEFVSSFEITTVYLSQANKYYNHQSMPNEAMKHLWDGR